MLVVFSSLQKQLSGSVLQDNHRLCFLLAVTSRSLQPSPLHAEPWLPHSPLQMGRTQQATRLQGAKWCQKEQSHQEQDLGEQIWGPCSHPSPYGAAYPMLIIHMLQQQPKMPQIPFECQPLPFPWKEGFFRHLCALMAWSLLDGKASSFTSSMWC